MGFEDIPWEQGSGFHWATPPPHHRSDWGWGDQRLYGTGRHALVALLRRGIVELGWRRLWVPAYYCHETVDAVSALLGGELSVRGFDDGPLNPVCAPPLNELNPGDVVLVVNYFGLFTQTRAPATLPHDVATIEDHTHDPWSEWARQSDAAYSFASLRKTLPVADGAAVRSPRGDDLPAAAKHSDQHEAAASLRLEAMLLKTLYLSGGPIAKSVFLDLQRRSEDSMGIGPVAAASIVTEASIPTFPVHAWRDLRMRNFSYAAERLSSVPGITVLQPETASATPFSVILVCRRRSERDRLVSSLIQQSIYPAVLWDLAEPARTRFPRHAELSDRLVSIHCDFRYTLVDMARVVDAVRTGSAE